MKKRSEVRKASAEVSNRLDTEDGGETVESVSQKLKDELSDAPSPFKYESANKAKLAPLRPDMAAIVETVFVNDLNETWKKLKLALEVGVRRSDHGTLQKALDHAESNAFLAHRLYITADVEYKRWERENEVIFSAMRASATRALQAEKDSGIRSKQITDADIKSCIAELFHDEFQHQEHERDRVRGTADALKDLSEQWKSRCRTLQVMMGKLRG